MAILSLSFFTSYFTKGCLMLKKLSRLTVSHFNKLSCVEFLGTQKSYLSSIQHSQEQVISARTIFSLLKKEQKGKAHRAKQYKRGWSGMICWEPKEVRGKTEHGTQISQNSTKEAEMERFAESQKRLEERLNVAPRSPKFRHKVQCPSIQCLRTDWYPWKYPCQSWLKSITVFQIMKFGQEHFPTVVLPLLTWVRLIPVPVWWAQRENPWVRKQLSMQSFPRESRPHCSNTAAMAEDRGVHPVITPLSGAQIREQNKLLKGLGQHITSTSPTHFPPALSLTAPHLSFSNSRCRRESKIKLTSILNKIIK